MGVLRRGELKMEIFKSRYVQVLGRIVRYLVMIFLGAILVFPFFYMVTRSFMNSTQVLARPVEMIPNPFTFEAYREIFLRNNYFGYLLRTLEIEIFNLIAIPLSASAVAYSFAKLRYRGKNFLFAVMLATMMLPGAVTQVPLYILFSKLGWLDTLLPLTIPNLFGGGAVYIFLIRQFMRGIPNDIDNAARIDGANAFVRFAVIVMPLCKPVLIYIMVQVFNACWGDFYGPLLYMSGEGKETLAYGIFKDSIYSDVSSARENMRMAAGTFMSIFPAMLFLIFQKQLIEGVTVSGLKG